MSDQVATATDQFYVTIKNSPALLEKLFIGMHKAARRFIGYNPQGSSYPLITGGAPWKGSAVTIEQREIHDSGRKETVGWHLTLSLTFLNKDTLDVLRQMDADLEDFNWWYRNCNCQALLQELVNEYWADMVKFAKKNQYYRKGWQQEVANGHCD